MTQEELLTDLKEIKSDLLHQFGIKEIVLFGSYARNDFTQESDVDLAIIDIEKKDYFIRAKAKHYLEKLLQKKVDLGYFDTIRPFIRKEIENEMIHV
jgi:predicted nucleotidyltransferase